MCQVDFIVQQHGDIYPIEVKGAENLQAKSLKIYCETYKPRVCVRTSLSSYRREDWLVNIPLYAIGTLDKILG